MSPRSTIENKKIRTESISKILDAAYRLMAKNGYESTSISQIANEAGVSKGLMYNYFHSKEDLLKALIDQTLRDGEKIMEGVFSDDPAETLENVLNGTSMNFVTISVNGNLFQRLCSELINIHLLRTW